MLSKVTISVIIGQSMKAHNGKHRRGVTYEEREKMIVNLLAHPNCKSFTDKKGLNIIITDVVYNKKQKGDMQIINHYIFR